jgi:hypothetical protein
MSFISDSFDLEALIERFAAPLLPASRAEFRRAAENALRHVPNLGEGLAHRTLVPLQHEFFDAPADLRQGPRSGSKGYLRLGRLANRPPVGRANSWVRGQRAG